MNVVIDIIGVIPDPAEMKRYFSAWWFRCEKSPAGPRALIRTPGARLSSIQRVPILSSCAFAAIEIDRGRDGEDEIV